MHRKVGSSQASHKIVGIDRWRPWLPTLALGLVWAAKLLVVRQLHEHPLLQPESGLDTSAYVDLANAVRHGNPGLGPGLYYLSPFYIYFLAVSLTLLQSFTAVRILQVTLGTASVAFVFLMTQAWFGRRAAWYAGALAAVTGLLTFYETILLQAAVDPFLTSAALLALTFALTRDDRRWLLAAGVLFGLATLNRPNMALAALGIGTVLLAQRRVLPAFVLVAGLLLGVSPVAIRNVVVAHQWSLVSSHGGLNFYIGNGEGATGFFRPLPGITPNITGQAEDARRVAEEALGHPLTDAETSDYFFARAWDWMAAHPAAAGWLLIEKLGFVFSAQHIALPHSYPFYAYDSPTALRYLVAGPWLLLPLGLAGLVFAAPHDRRRDFQVWASFVPAYAVAVAAFFVAERYRLPLLIPMCVGAGAAIDGALALLAERRGSRPIVPALAVVLLFAAVNWPHDLQDGRWEEGLRMAERMIAAGRLDVADAWAAQSAAREPKPGATDYAIGAQLLAARQTGAALRHLRQAQAQDPQTPAVAYALGQALRADGQTAAAVPHLRRGFDAGIELPQGGLEFPLALHETGDTAGALAAVRRLPPPGRDPDACLRVGRLASELGAPDVAEPFFRRAAALAPTQAGVRLQYGLNLLVLHRCEAAVRELGEAIRLDPRDADGLARLSYCELELGRTADARGHAAAALALNPGDPLATQLFAALDKPR